MTQPAKQFRLRADQIRPLATGLGGCIASDRITVEGRRVGFMYRDEPHNPQDSGWRFLAGDESDAYMDDPDHHSIYDVNTIANYDTDVIPLLDAPIGASFERDETGALVQVSMPHPHFPVVSGVYHPSPGWSITLPGEFSQRMEDEDHVLWRPGFTVWLSVWDDPGRRSPEERLRGVREAMSPDAFAVEEERSDGVVRLSYRLTEPRPEGVVHAVYGYVMGPAESVSVGVYMDDEAHLPYARSIVRGIRYHADGG